MLTAKKEPHVESAKLTACCLLALGIVVTTDCPTVLVAADRLPAAILIRIREERSPEVISFAKYPPAEEAEGAGLLIWRQGPQEACQAYPPGEPSHVVSRSNGAEGVESGSPAGGAKYLGPHIDRLLGQLVVRGSGFLTPVPGPPTGRRPLLACLRQDPG